MIRVVVVVSFYYCAGDPYPDTSVIIVIMIVVVLGAFACLIRWRKYLLVRRQYEQCMNECMNDVFVQHKHRVRS